MSSVTLTIHTHYQVSVTERRRMPHGLNERQRKNPSLRPSWVQKRTWNTSEDDKARRFGHYKFNVPQWLMPKNGVHVFHTLTASIIWGLAGKMGDNGEDET